MDTYSLMREFADSWMLLFLFCFFVGVVLWAFRPSSKQTHKDVANIPFRHENKPATTREDGISDVNERIAEFKEARI